MTTITQTYRPSTVGDAIRSGIDGVFFLAISCLMFDMLVSVFLA